MGTSEFAQGCEAIGFEGVGFSCKPWIFWLENFWLHLSRRCRENLWAFQAPSRANVRESQCWRKVKISFFDFLNRWSGCNLTEFKGWDKIPHISSLLTYACLLCKLMLEQLWGFLELSDLRQAAVAVKAHEKAATGPFKGWFGSFFGTKSGFPDFHHKVLIWGTEFMVYQFGEWFMLTICLYTFIISWYIIMRDSCLYTKYCIIQIVCVDTSEQKICQKRCKHSSVFWNCQD